MHRGDGLVQLEQVGPVVAGDGLGGQAEAGRPSLLVDAEAIPGGLGGALDEGQVGGAQRREGGQQLERVAGAQQGQQLPLLALGVGDRVGGDDALLHLASLDVSRACSLARTDRLATLKPMERSAGEIVE
jgi:hypothetical protein